MEAFKLKNTIPGVKHGGGSIMLEKKNAGAIRKKDYLEILKQQLKTSGRKFKL